MTKKLNKLFPGRPNYIGPTTGWFGLLHHEELLEHSHNVMERVAYVKANKPENEITTRLHNMIYLGKVGGEYQTKLAPLYADFAAKRNALYAKYKAKRNALYAKYKAKRAPLYADYAAKRNALYANYAAKRNALYAKYKAKCNALYADYQAKRAPIDTDYAAQCAPLNAEVLAYIKKHIPDCAWDGETLVFPEVR